MRLRLLVWVQLPDRHANRQLRPLRGGGHLHERAECEAYLAGRGTEIMSPADRARSGVTKAIGRALKAIRTVHEGLAHHLERHVETGRLCMYVPDPATPVTFEF